MTAKIMGDKSSQHQLKSMTNVNNQVMNFSKYWMLVTIDGMGERKLKEITVAKTFAIDVFTNLRGIDEMSDTLIQKQLFNLFENNTGEQSLLAQRSLLCFISWNIEQVCLQLVRQFGNFHGFTQRDLLPYVLDDDGSLQPSNKYQCVARQILQTFDSEKSSLNSWTSRKVKQHDPLNKFLLECGVYLISDWAILNDTKIQQLPKILGEFHSLTSIEIERSQKILAAYHTIYRIERLEQRGRGYRGRCKVPTTEQLEKMREILNQTEMSQFSHERLLGKLQQIASQLREYRIYVRGGKFIRDSLDEQLNQKYTLLENIPAENSENLTIEVDHTQEFLQAYRLQMSNCLDSALNSVVRSRVGKLQKKNSEKANNFTTALYLFHCKRLSMGEIAKKLGLRAQDTVTRLLKLKEFRADVRQEILLILRESILDIAQNYSTPERLKKLDLQINEAIEEEINKVISQADKEASTIKSNIPMSCFSQTLCKQLEERRKTHD
ncbi:MAG: hypothetical protein QNJ49_12235, partial [Mastigocoleus sp. MO_167.B18]|nr:hypothetical protein [Mastigocoleus sp. MO_167.B18]